MRNWKTTLAGFGLAALNLLANGTGWEQALLSAGLAAFGTLTKDFNVTGAK